MNLKNLAPLVLIGAGNMGGAMLTGWLQQGLPNADVTVVDPAPMDHIQALCREHSVALAVSPKDIHAKAGILLLAVKPQLMDKVLPTVSHLVGEATLVVSIAAGTTIERLNKALPPCGGLVRVMPNTPAQVARSMSVAVADRPLSPTITEILTALLSAIGDVAWIDNEADMDAVTALSGSGPAYVFHLVEAMTEAGIKAGLSPDLAAKLARSTIAGAGELVRQSAEPASVLRKQVTSPGGTTAAGLSVLMQQHQGLTDLMTKTVAAAAERSRELGKD